MKGVIIMYKVDYNTIFVQVINFPRRKMILKRIADNCQCFDFSELIYSKDWAVLASINEALYEPAVMWWAQSKADIFPITYLLGVEVPVSYNGEVPMGFDMINLPPCKMMFFQGNDLNTNGAVDFHSQIEKYNPKINGFQWAIEDAPGIMLVPMEYRGHIEARPVRLASE
jgi:AraC family transcriptional regulator